MAPMDDQRNSSSPEMGFAGYGAYNVNRQEFPSGISLPFPPQFAAHEPRCLTPAVPIFAGRFTSIRRSSQSSVDDPRPFLRPRDQPSQNDYEMTYQQEEFPEEESPEPSLEQGIPTDPMENTSEFVKMLFNALEDPIFQSVMCWSLLGDCFMIKDVEKFTKTLLPRLYNHSNFAGFVRQLKKYDFHKVDKAEDNDGYQNWCFRHSNFHANKSEDLENVKRKPTIHQRSGNAETSSWSFSASNYNPSDSSASPVRATFTSHTTSSPYLQSSNSNSSSNDHSSIYEHKVGLGSRSPSRAELYSEIQSLKQETEDSKVKMRDLDRTSEKMRTTIEHLQKSLDDQGGVLRLLAAQHLSTNEVIK